MSQNWAKSFSYREALDGLQARIAQLQKQDRLVTAELMPNIASIDGYLFAINAAPADVSPTEWLGELLPLVQLPDEKPAEAVNMLISYAMHSKARMAQQKYALPVERDAIAALRPGAALNSFSHGFEVGYRRIESIWSATIAEELRAELNSQVFALKFFASTDHAKQFIKERELKLRPDQLADQILSNLDKAADLHVRLGMAISAGQETRH